MLFSHHIGIQVPPNVHVALKNAVVRCILDPGCLQAYEGGLEERLGTPKALVANGDDLSIGQLVGLVER